MKNKMRPIKSTTIFKLAGFSIIPVLAGIATGEEWLIIFGLILLAPAGVIIVLGTMGTVLGLPREIMDQWRR